MENPKPSFFSVRTPFFARLVRRLFSRKTAVVLIWLATLIVLFYTEENWRARRAWEKYRKEWEAKGEVFDLTALIPPPIPDEQNFAMAPFFEDVRQIWNRRKNPSLQYDTNLMEHLKINIFFHGKEERFAHALSSWSDARKTDFATLQTYYRAPSTPRQGQTINPLPVAFPMPTETQAAATDVLLALSNYDAVYLELRSASQRPYSRFPINYDDTFMALLPHLAKLKYTSKYLQLRADAELAAGKTQLAAEDTGLLFYITDSIKTEPLAISQFVRFALWHVTLDTIWEGLDDHQWSDEQLQKFQEKLESPDLLADWRHAVEGERCFQFLFLDELNAQRSAHPLASKGIPSSNPLKYLIHLVPQGWFVQNKLLAAQLMQENAISPLEMKSGTLSAEAVKPPELDRRLWHFNPYNWFARLLVPVLQPNQAVRAQTALRLGATACALERYRLAHQEYPQTLDVLVPQYISQVPREIIGGKPLKYQRTDDGSFVLYSTGLDGKDFGGESRNAKGKENGNWVWRYPAK